MAGNSRDAGRSVTARALSVLTAFDIDHSRLTLTAIARRAGIPLATAHRLVRELEHWGRCTATPKGGTRSACGCGRSACSRR
ncbi:helix-turn-helix domain-containing protein [Saccharopolyspora spinosporotrichia]